MGITFGDSGQRISRGGPPGEERKQQRERRAHGRKSGMEVKLKRGGGVGGGA